MVSCVIWPARNNDNRLIILDANWFKAQMNICKIQIKGGNYHIKQDAFKSRSFENMTDIAILPTNLTFENGFLDSQKSIRTLLIQFGSFSGNFARFVQPFREELSYLGIDPLADSVQFNDLFEQINLPNIMLVETRCRLQSDETQRTITLAALAGLKEVLVLRLEHCGIVSVEPKALYSLTSLETVSLAFNRLKVFDYRFVHLYFERPLIVHAFLLKIYLNDNPFICDCQFYEMKSLLLHKYRVGSNYSLECEHLEAIDEQPTCENVQLIHTKPNCLVHVNARESFYVYTKFNLKQRMEWNERSVLIKTNAYGHFRVILVNYYDKIFMKRHRCTDRYLLKAVSKCYRMPNATHTIPISDFLGQFPLLFVGVIYQKANDFVWPLHFIAINGDSALPIASWLLYYQSLVICLGGLMVGIGIAFGYQKHRM